MFGVTETTRHGGTWYYDGAGWSTTPVYFFSSRLAAEQFQARKSRQVSDKPRLYAVVTP